MQPAPYKPKLHLFICTNRRDEENVLGPGCGERGFEIYRALKQRVAEEGVFSSVWVTQTACMGICPRSGATVAVYPSQAIFTAVEPEDADGLYDRARAEQEQ